MEEFIYQVNFDVIEEIITFINNSIENPEHTTKRINDYVDDEFNWFAGDNPEKYKLTQSQILTICYFLSDKITEIRNDTILAKFEQINEEVRYV